MPAKKVIWVYPSGDVWVVKKTGTSKASAIRNTRKEAYEAARNIALNQNLHIKIRSADGSLKNISPREARESDSSDCFITTACVNYHGLSDDCYQLSILRNFRDSYLNATRDRRDLVAQYYEVAPKIVAILDSRNDRAELYYNIFEKINEACGAIEDDRPEVAKEIYSAVVRDLADRFKEQL